VAAVAAATPEPTFRQLGPADDPPGRPSTSAVTARPGWPAAPPIGSGSLLPGPKVAPAWSADGGPDPLHLPIAVAVGGRGDVYVVDAGAGRLRVFDRDGRPDRAWGGPGDDDGQFRFRRPDRCGADDAYGCFPDVGGGVAVDYRDRVYVADWANHRLQVFDRAGRFLARWGRPGDGPGEFDLPAAVAVDGRGRVYVADSGNARIQVLDEAGRFLAAWGRRGVGAGTFVLPSALAVDGQGRVAVADPMVGAVQWLNDQGQVVARWAPDGPSVMSKPHGWGLATDRNGQLYASAMGGRLYVFDAGGTALIDWDPGWLGEARTAAPAGLAVDGAGGVFVADRGARRLHKVYVLLPVAG
jgi:DNA-binding beta-propeller fold protein YncE